MRLVVGSLGFSNQLLRLVAGNLGFSNWLVRLIVAMGLDFINRLVRLAAMAWVSVTGCEASSQGFGFW